MSKKNIREPIFTVYLSKEIPPTDKKLLLRTNSIEMVAGMMACSIGILHDENLKHPKNRFYLITNADISDYIILRAVLIDKIKENPLLNYLKESYMGIWLKSNMDFRYNFFQYQTNDFIQGITEICNYFNVDLRDYMYRYPIDYYGNEYDIMGYNKKSVVICQDAPDLYDIEEEEKSNENIIEPFARTDD